MVDFRYHLVSIVAVFLALATGIAIGATALNGGAVHILNGQIRSLINDKNQLRSEYSAVQGEADGDVKFIKAVTPGLVAGAVRGKRVAVVSLPGADKASRDQALQTLAAAGATVTAQIRLTDRVLDPQSSSLVDDLAARLVTAAVALPSGDSTGRLGTVLGSVLVRPSGPTPTSTAELIRVIAGLRDAGMIAVDGKVAVGSLAVVIANAPPAQTSSARDSLDLGLTRELDAFGSGTVVVGPVNAAEAGGGVAAIRGDARTALIVSSVDGMDRAAGPLTFIRALLEQLRGGVGQYGTGAGATALIATSAR